MGRKEKLDRLTTGLQRLPDPGQQLRSGDCCERDYECCDEVVDHDGRVARLSERTVGHTSKRDTKKGPRRQEVGMAPPLPNSAHGDQLISAKPRGTARFCATFICDALETDWLAEAAGFKPLHLQIRSAELRGSGRRSDAINFSRSAARAPAIRDAQVRVLSARLRVLVNSDLRCRGSNPAA